MLAGGEVRAEEVMRVLLEERGNEENALMELFNYEHVEIVKAILAHTQDLVGIEEEKVHEKRQIDLD